MEMKFCCRYVWTFTDLSQDNRFMDRFVVSHATWEVTERRFLMDESVYKGYLAWLLLIQILPFEEDTSIFNKFIMYTRYI